ncbi:MAG: indolepyruvate ferredoxin oxidoreductase subunit alpha [Chloroflexi bacterium]|nr:indolepyruvate ferredoxin oxidoreductase subunit alpha [Chloroflexota bacterium]
MKTLLSGNQAIARGAYESGVVLASAYPGTPSTEILETMVQYPEIISEWAPNEKVALDVAIGGAYAGVRSMAVMKHVGLNVAADAFFYVSMTGTEGGLVIISADDPAMHSSQNEQDNRCYAKFARVPCLEPSDSQDAKDLVGAAYEISEQFDTPVLLRTTTRIAHSHTLVELGERPVEADERQVLDYRIDRTKYVMVPGNARKRHPVIEARVKQLAEFAETFSHNRLEMGNTSVGIITNGIAFQYAKEVFPGASILRLGMTYPLPPNLIRDFASKVDRLIVIEELDPFIEEEIRLMGIAVEGKSIFPITGEFDPDLVRQCAIRSGLLSAPGSAPNPQSEKGFSLPLRPPLLCPGCPHRGVFAVTNKLKLLVNGDIGCYTLGFLPPLSALHTCGCMGASIGVAHGVSKVGIKQKNVAVIGDSTFFHTGMPALLNVAYNQSDTVTLILDNRTTAMTGHQENPATGRTLAGEPTFAVDFEALVWALGIEHVNTVDAYNLKQVEAALREALDVAGPAVVIVERACALLPEVRKAWMPIEVDAERCNGCGLCFEIGCPAILRSEKADPKSGRFLAEIDPLLCTGCEICAQVCARGAIFTREQMQAKQEVEA